jgi:hypothetical protein
MAFTLLKNPDGDLSLGNLRGELCTLQDSVSDYAPGGYLVQGIGGTTESTGNVGLDKVLFVIPVGGQGGYSPVFNPTTSKLQVFEPSNALGVQSEVPVNTDLSAYAFQLLVVGL